MRRATRARVGGAIVAGLLLVSAACGDDGDDGDAAGAEDSERAAAAPAAFCDKATEFQEATSSVQGIASADEMQAAVDRLDGVAAEAPEEMQDEFETLGEVLERLVEAMRTTEGQDVAATVTAMQKVLTPETSGAVEDASRNVEAYLAVGCGLDDAAGSSTTTTAATPPTSVAPADPAALGADAALAPLAVACHGGDMVKCDELYFASPAGSPYEAYGNSCGQRTTVDAFCVDLYPPPAD